MTVQIELEELSEETQGFLRRARDEGVLLNITDHGEIVAHITPGTRHRRPTADEIARHFAAIDELAEEIAKTWPKGVSAVDAVNDVRRDL
ncbi:MAG: hypothetical protein ACRDJH_04980 [Thermomicrobiales bacterium]